MWWCSDNKRGTSPTFNNANINILSFDLVIKCFHILYQNLTWNIPNRIGTILPKMWKLQKSRWKVCCANELRNRSWLSCPRRESSSHPWTAQTALRGPMGHPPLGRLRPPRGGQAGPKQCPDQSLVTAWVKEQILGLSPWSQKVNRTNLVHLNKLSYTNDWNFWPMLTLNTQECIGKTKTTLTIQCFLKD